MLNGLTEITKDTSLKTRGLELISINGTLHCVQFFYEDRYTDFADFRLSWRIMAPTMKIVVCT